MSGAPRYVHRDTVARHEDGDSTFLRNVSKQPDYTSRTSWEESSHPSLWGSQTSQLDVLVVTCFDSIFRCVDTNICVPSELCAHNMIHSCTVLTICRDVKLERWGLSISGPPLNILITYPLTPSTLADGHSPILPWRGFNVVRRTRFHEVRMPFRVEHAKRQDAYRVPCCRLTKRRLLKRSVFRDITQCSPFRRIMSPSSSHRTDKKEISGKTSGNFNWRVYTVNKHKHSKPSLIRNNSGKSSGLSDNQD
jgi:hypothetical protein